MARVHCFAHAEGRACGSCEQGRVSKAARAQEMRHI
jgi:hypothetical protein